jgi:hypothetical protein
VYHETGINLGQGKYGTVNLIIRGVKEMLALKQVNKFEIDSSKRI